MKRILLMLFLILGSFGFSQEANENVIDKIVNKIKVEDLSNEDSFNSYSKKMVWDLNNFKHENRSIVIEILLIKDCYKAEKAERFREPIFLNINEKDFNYKGKYLIIHDKVRVKCFKWRVSIQENNETTNSEWRFISVL